MRRIPVLLAAPLALTVSLLVPRAAEACSMLSCEPEAMTPSSTTIPINAPGLVIRVARNATDENPDPAPALEAEDGTPIAASVTLMVGSDRDFLIAPTSPLEVGATYRLSSNSHCEGRQPVAVHRAVATFTTAPAQPLPTESGTLEVTASRVPEHWVGSAGSCLTPIDAAVAQLKVTPSAALLPFLPVTRWHVTVDGREWATSAWNGRRTSGALDVPVVADVPGLRPDQIFATCGTHPQHAQAGVAPGAHTVEVTAEVAGHGRLSPIVATIQLDCEESGAGPDETPSGCGASGLHGLGLLGLALLSPLLRRRRATHPGA